MSRSQPEMAENTDFKTLWASFEEKPFGISLNQAKLLFEGLHELGELTEPVIDNIIWSISVPKNFINTVMATKHYDEAPNRRMVLWRSGSDAIFSAVVWEKGAHTHIHNHSHFGLTRAIIGNITSIGFRKTDNNKLICVGHVYFERNRVYHVPAGQSFIHSVANFGDTDVLELHYYGPTKAEEPSYIFVPEDENFDIRKVQDSDEFSYQCIQADTERFKNRFV